MIKKMHTQNIFFRISLLFVLTVLIIIALIGYFSTRYYTRFLTAEITASNTHLLRNVQNTIDNIFFNTAEELSYDLQPSTYTNPDLFYLLSHPVKEYPKYIPPARTLLSNIVARRAPSIHSAAVYFKDNNLIISSLSGVKYLDLTSVRVPFDTDWTTLFVNENRGRNSMWLNTREHPPITIGSTGDRIITYIRTIPLTSSLENSSGLLAININENEIKKELQKTVKDNGSVILITDTNGNVISHSNQIEIKNNISDESFWRRIDPQRQEGFIADFNGTPNVFAVTQSPIRDYYYIHLESAENFFKPIVMINNIVLFICSAGLLLAIVLSTSVTGRILAPLKPLVTLSVKLLRTQGKEPEHEGGLALVGDALRILNTTSADLKELLARNREKIEHAFYFDLLHDRIHQKQEILERLDYLKSDYPYPAFSVLIVQFDLHTIDNLNIEQSEYLLHSLIQKIRLEIQTTVAIIDDKYRIALIKNHPQDISSSIPEIIDSITMLTQTAFRLECQFGIGTAVQEITRIYQSYDKAKSAIKYACIHRKKKIFDFRETSIWDNNHHIQMKKIEKLPELIRSCNKRKSIALLNTLKRSIIESNGSYKEYIKVVEQISHIVDEIAANLNIGTEDKHQPEDMERTGGFYYMDDVFAYLELKTRNLINALDEKRDQQTVLYVVEAKTYIQEHLDQDLSLDLVADRLNICVTYLSRIFKAVSNEGFLKYVTRMRMEKAALMLKEIKVKAGDIASQVGFHDYSYFSLIFKKHYGTTPNKYRKEYSAYEVVS